MLWGGRFKKELDPKALKFSSSLSIDSELILEDIEGSKVHAEMLSRTGIISSDDGEKILKGLEQIESDWKDQKWKPDSEKFEDIHSAVESRLYELIGDTAGKLHTGRSRNDQVALDLKLWVRKKGGILSGFIKNLQIVLLNLSSENVNTIIPGYTHLQRAQPVSLAFHFLAYIEMLERDKSRLDNYKTSLTRSPLGSGALAGTTLPLDRSFTSEKLGFNSFSENALDSVSDRDFILDMLNICVIGMMHLSRFAEELILWSTAEWNFVKFGDEISTGSSLMPQKRNPDLAELIRGKTGRVYGNYIALAAVMKGLPLSYNRDMQEDKESLFDSVKTYSDSLEIMVLILNNLMIYHDRFKAELSGDFILATDLADQLVMKGIPFREAHEIVGSIIKDLEEQGKDFNNIDLDYLQSMNPAFDSSSLECLNFLTSLDRKKTPGSPNRTFVEERIKYWQMHLK